MGKITQVLFLTFLAAITITQTGCSKDKKSPSLGNRGRNNGYAQDRYFDRNNPSSQAGEWGVIYNNASSMDAVLVDFMYGITDLGFVSGSMDDDTGVRFRGQVNDQAGTGRIDLLVWDDQANMGSDPYYWTLNVVRVTNGGATIVAKDRVGEITFTGRFQSGEFTGTASFVNTETDGARGTLGTFSIAECALFPCN